MFKVQLCLTCLVALSSKHCCKSTSQFSSWGLSQKMRETVSSHLYRTGLSGLASITQKYYGSKGISYILVVIFNCLIHEIPFFPSCTHLPDSLQTFQLLQQMRYGIYEQILFMSQLWYIPKAVPSPSLTEAGVMGRITVWYDKFAQASLIFNLWLLDFPATMMFF